MTYDDIKQLIDLVKQTGIAELEVEREGNRVRIRSAGSQQEIVLAPHHAPHAAVPAPIASAPLVAPGAPPAAPAEDTSLVYVKSPIVGTYYDSPNPDAPAFVNVGDTVRTGQVLCIIESMKLMNEIESEISGAVVQKLVKNGQPVEYGEALLAIRPS
jgi:acetyl-CoA carboxylase biotin carboxyl carrier protein